MKNSECRMQNEVSDSLFSRFGAQTSLAHFFLLLPSSFFILSYLLILVCARKTRGHIPHGVLNCRTSILAPQDAFTTRSPSPSTPNSISVEPAEMVCGTSLMIGGIPRLSPRPGSGSWISFTDPS